MAAELYCGGYAVCIDASDCAGPNKVERGRVYTVTGLSVSDGARFVEIDGQDIRWQASRFKALDDTKLAWAWDIADGSRAVPA